MKERTNVCWLAPCLLVLLTWGWTGNSFGQNEEDVLRYSWLDPLSSTRVMAMGGAFGALGADLGCLGINPAGLGMYRRGDLGMTAGIASAQTTTN